MRNRFIRRQRSAFDIDDSSYHDTQMAAALVTSIIYLTACLPLVWIFAEKAGKDFLSVLLFIDTPPTLKSFFGYGVVGFDSNFEAAFWFSIGVFYSAFGLLAPVFRRLHYKTLDLIGTITGFALGYFATVLALSILYRGSYVAPSMQIAGAHLLYIYLAFTVVELCKQRFSWIKSSETKYRIDMMLDGVFGLLAAALFSIGQQAAPEIVTGPLFLVLSFFSMILIGNTLVRAQMAMFISFADNKKFERWRSRKPERRESILATAKFFLGEMKKNMALPMDKLRARLQPIFSAAQPAAALEKWTINPTWFLFMLALNLVFPLLGFYILLKLLS